MIFAPKRSNRPYPELSGAAESVAEHRSRLARELEDTQQRRMDAMAAQVSISNGPAERILIWEQLHGLPLPLSPDHRLVGVIAAATDLQIDQVKEVQRLRLTRGNTSAPTAPELPNP
jgi:hypothetical protein